MDYGEIQLQISILPFISLILKYTIFLGICIVILVYMIKFIRNSFSAFESANCVVISKRTFINYQARTEYFITFEFENKQRKEYRVKPHDFGLIVEGDKGILTFQGTQFKNFERSI